MIPGDYMYAPDYIYYVWYVQVNYVVLAPNGSGDWRSSYCFIQSEVDSYFSLFEEYSFFGSDTFEKF
jgi:hypothetical protein